MLIPETRDLPVPPQGPEVQNTPARRVASNALNPFIAQVVTKLLMLGYGVVQFRLVSGALLGDYILATIIFLYTSTISDWGLGTLLTREVAKERGDGDAVRDANARIAALFEQTLTLRVAISLVLFVPVIALVAVYLAFFHLSTEGAWAALLLSLSLLPGAFSGSVTALLYAYERMSLPAAIGVATSVLNVVLGIASLLLGWGVLGLATSASLSTLLTAALFGRIMRRDFPALSMRIDPGALRAGRAMGISLLKAGWPLMLNALLVGLFFRADQFVIKADTAGGEVARYDAAYRFLNFVLLITPAVTLALFPRMARHAATDRPRLAYEYGFALKVLLLLSVPIVALTVWFAPLLITVVTGAKAGYLPESAAVLQILIFFLPFSFVNGLTQYVLIALDLQRLITRAFAATVIFNLAANLLLVPLLGIYGAALTTVLSELVLLGPFLLWTVRALGSAQSALVPASWVLKPLLGGLAAGALGYVLRSLMERWNNSLAEAAIYLGAGLLLLAVYGAVVLATRPFTGAELATLVNAFRFRARETDS
jgi:O-antigen/teichoic acid export membrane protein